MPNDKGGPQVRKLSPAEVAERLFVTDKTVRNWMNTNGLPFSESSSRGRMLDWREALNWYVGHRAETIGSPGKRTERRDAEEAVETYDAALGRKTRAEADLKELQLAKARGEVAAIADVQRILTASNLSVQTQMLALPSRLAPQMLGLENHSRAVQIIESEVRQTLSNLATIDAVREAANLEFEEEK